MAPSKPSVSSGAWRRRLIAAISVLANIALIIVTVHEWQRMEACRSATQAAASGSKLAVSHADQQLAADNRAQNHAPLPVPHRRILELAVDAPINMAAPSRPVSTMNRAAAPAGRSLLGVETADAAAAAAAPSLGTLWSAPPPSDELRIPGDLSALDPPFDLAKHEYTWNYCPLVNMRYNTSSAEADAEDEKHLRQPEVRPFCSEKATSEQKWQMEWFGAHVVPGAPRRPLPLFLPCTHLPPQGFRWPDKRPNLPATSPAVHYPNLRISALEDLKEFNKATPKNLYHFDAPKYDLDALEELRLGERFIPFARKVRLMLDVGAGGGSLGLLVKHKYDVQSLSTVFADWPYCEYISERGGACILLDSMEATPFAKFTFDVVHLSWVYHGQEPDELRVMMHEINRIIRPGGYLWLRGGWAQVQLEFLQSFLTSTLGYVPLHNVVQPKPKEVTSRVFFGKDQTLPYAADWSAIFVKPIAKVNAQGDCAKKLQAAATTAA